ncbi:iron ABC transporter permease [Pseudoflavitalea sp. G-6-1-2]|uniref:FecCD family ABC transporter permease n=1 Tax=Pseudoflavitalea sp. G-6-1-2 TaxID=2728841 RepID=UPI001469B4B6|nr:iron ABC transporter permease [Pseudoflavitalea sp. G-6-1-2]NML20855.1 iron ABC transporter permease [Pseudoflavitalea sp. G-6-1-2]
MNRKIANIICYALPVPVLVLSLFIGSSENTDFGTYISLLYKKLSDGLNATETESYNMISNIIWNVRLPRVVLTFLIGAALSTSGTVLQAIFRNPLVDSYVLGISAGAAFGAALSITYGGVPVNIAAFIGGTLAVLATYSMAGSGKQSSIVSIVLAGMVVSGMFTAFLAIVQYISNPYKLQAIVQWTMGNLHAASWIELKQTLIPVIAGLLIVFIYRWRINLLALGDDAAKAVGVNPALDKLILIGCATLMTATTVAAAGIISFYGLFLPHIVRMLIGADNVKAIPGNIFLGGTFLLVIDNFSRSLFAFEVPVGIFTMLLGGPFFIYLMRKNKINWA